MNLLLCLVLIICASVSVAQFRSDQDSPGFQEDKDTKSKHLKGDLDTHQDNDLQTAPSDDMLALATGYHKKKHGKGHKGVKGHSGHSGHKGKKFGKKHEDHWKKHSNSKGKHSKGHHDSKKYHGDHFKGNKGHKGAKFGKKGHKHKGHVTKGFKNTHHKNEFSKKTKFYDSFDNGGYHKKFGGYKGKYGGSKGNKFKGGKLKGFFKGGKFGKKHHHDKGKHSSKHKGHKGHYEEKGDYGHKSSHSKGGKGKHHYGHSGIHPVYVLPDQPIRNRRSADINMDEPKIVDEKRSHSKKRQQEIDNKYDFYQQPNKKQHDQGKGNVGFYGHKLSQIPHTYSLPDQPLSIRRSGAGGDDDDDDDDIDMEIEMEEKRKVEKSRKKDEKRRHPTKRQQEIDDKYDFYQHSNEDDYEPSKDIPQISIKNDVDPEILAEKTDDNEEGEREKPKASKRPSKKHDVMESRKDEHPNEEKEDNEDEEGGIPGPIDRHEYQNMNEDLNENHRPPSEEKFNNDYNEAEGLADFGSVQPRTTDLNYEFTDEDLMEKTEASNEKDDFPKSFKQKVKNTFRPVRQPRKRPQQPQPKEVEEDQQDTDEEDDYQDDPKKVNTPQFDTGEWIPIPNKNKPSKSQRKNPDQNQLKTPQPRKHKMKQQYLEDHKDIRPSRQPSKPGNSNTGSWNRQNQDPTFQEQKKKEKISKIKSYKQSNNLNMLRHHPELNSGVDNSSPDFTSPNEEGQNYDNVGYDTTGPRGYPPSQLNAKNYDYRIDQRYFRPSYTESHTQDDLILPRIVHKGYHPSRYAYPENPSLDLTGSSLPQIPDSPKRRYISTSSPRMEVPKYVSPERQYYTYGPGNGYIPERTQRSYIPNPKMVPGNSHYQPYDYHDHDYDVYG